MLYYTEWHSEPRLDGVRVWVAASGGAEHVAMVVQVQAPRCLKQDLSQNLRVVGHEAPRCSAGTQRSKFRVVGKPQWKTEKADRSCVPWAWTGEHSKVWLRLDSPHPPLAGPRAASLTVAPTL